MRNIKTIVILFNLVCLIGYINWATFHKEKTISEGTLMLFELRPVDPRSLMQGDYMDLRYAAANQGRTKDKDELPKFGFGVVTLDKNSVVTLSRYQESKTPLEEGEFLIKYAIHRRGVSFGAESYFFEEGTGERFEKAEYGGLRVDDEGKSILIGLYDKDFKFIEL
ncbi:MAG: GDYXXLXY domain-containing protein [Saprospiraceae bacterium]